jgi:hypothetical protein
MYNDHEIIARGERLYPALELEHIGAEGGPPTYRHDRTSTPTFDAHIQAEASRIERELRERADRWRDDEEVSDTDVSDEGGDEQTASTRRAKEAAEKLRAHAQLRSEHKSRVRDKMSRLGAEKVSTEQHRADVACRRAEHQNGSRDARVPSAPEEAATERGRSVIDPALRPITTRQVEFSLATPTETDDETRKGENKPAKHESGLTLYAVDRGGHLPTSDRPAKSRITAGKTRTRSAERQQEAPTVVITANWLAQSVQSTNSRSISDVVVAPKPFTAKAGVTW